MKIIKYSKQIVSDDKLIFDIRQELIEKLEIILHDLKGEPCVEPKQDFDHTFIYIYESDYRRNFEYTKRMPKTDISNNKVEWQYNKYFKK